MVQLFEAFLATTDQNPSQLKPTDQNVSQFLDFFLEQHEGAALGDTDVDADDSEPACASPYTRKSWTWPYSNRLRNICRLCPGEWT